MLYTEADADGKEEGKFKVRRARLCSLLACELVRVVYYCPTTTAALKDTAANVAHLTVWP